MGYVRHPDRAGEGGRLMRVKDVWDIFGGILLVAIIAVILTKKNTAKDVSATGKAFTGALSTAEKG
jgi:hypothetical protein